MSTVAASVLSLPISNFLSENESNTSTISMCNSPCGPRVYFVRSGSSEENYCQYEVHGSNQFNESGSDSNEHNANSTMPMSPPEQRKANSFAKLHDIKGQNHDESDSRDIEIECVPSRMSSLDEFLREMSDEAIPATNPRLKDNMSSMSIKLEEYVNEQCRGNGYYCIIPVVCDRSNTQFYSQCDTKREGWCCRCCKLVKNQKYYQRLKNNNNKNTTDHSMDSINLCRECGGRLAAKYHQWYSNLSRIEALDRCEEVYNEHSDVLSQYNIEWNQKNARKRKYVMDNYLLLKIIFEEKPNQINDIRAIHLERTFMIGVFAGREFRTTRKARQFLKKNLKLKEFNCKFPRHLSGAESFSHEARISIADRLNKEFFYGYNVAYFHAHKKNIEGYYDENIICVDRISASFNELIKEYRI